MTFVILLILGVSLGINLAQYLNNLNLKAKLEVLPPRERPLDIRFDAMRFGVPPEGTENRHHRRTQFPKL